MGLQEDPKWSGEGSTCAMGEEFKDLLGLCIRFVWTRRCSRLLVSAAMALLFCKGYLLP